jgi:hypothetical protein
VARSGTAGRRWTSWREVALTGLREVSNVQVELGPVGAVSGPESLPDLGGLVVGLSERVRAIVTVVPDQGHHNRGAQAKSLEVLVEVDPILGRYGTFVCDRDVDVPRNLAVGPTADQPDLVPREPALPVVK